MTSCVLYRCDTRQYADPLMVSASLTYSNLSVDPLTSFIYIPTIEFLPPEIELNDMASPYQGAPCEIAHGKKNLPYEYQVLINIF